MEVKITFNLQLQVHKKIKKKNTPNNNLHCFILKTMQ